MAFQRIWRCLRSSRPAPRIRDGEKKLGNFSRTDVGYDVTQVKEEVARQYILGRPGTGQKFLDVGARDGQLTYLLGINGNLEYVESEYRKNKAAFAEKYQYFGLDLQPSDDPSVLTGDICTTEFASNHPTFGGFFDVIYSNNVFEHLRRPWIAASNLMQMLKPNGICVTITPFSLRYHECPGDYFRYTAPGLISLFEDAGNIKVHVGGYDITGRRNNWQGGGEANDICPVDHFGAWRENWFTVVIIEKTGPGIT